MAKKRASKADKDPDVIRIKALRDKLADKEKAGEACKGLYKCHKSPKAERDKCIKKIEDGLHSLLEKQKKTGGARGSKRAKSKRSKRSKRL